MSDAVVVALIGLAGSGLGSMLGILVSSHIWNDIHPGYQCGTTGDWTDRQDLRGKCRRSESAVYPYCLSTPKSPTERSEHHA